jgi:hypothetical protein
MTLTDKNIEDFRAIYKARFGKEITEEYARHHAPRLVRLMELVYQPMTKTDMEMVLKRQAELQKGKVQN